MPHPIEALPPGCPWADWTRPNLKWCEQLQCSWIVTPSNTWSNLFYMFAALLMHFRVKSMRKDELLSWFPLATFLVGFSSLCYHASYTLVFQYFDFFGMYCYLVLAVELSLRRHVRLPRPGLVSLLLLPTMCALTILFSHLKIPYQLLVLLLILTVLALNIKSLGDADLAQSLGFIVVAASFSAADQANLFCQPESLLQGHALWHVLGSISTYKLFMFFAKQQSHPSLPLNKR